MKRCLGTGGCVAASWIHVGLTLAPSTSASLSRTKMGERGEEEEEGGGGMRRGEEKKEEEEEEEEERIREEGD